MQLFQGVLKRQKCGSHIWRLDIRDHGSPGMEPPEADILGLSRASSLCVLVWLSSVHSWALIISFTKTDFTDSYLISTEALFPNMVTL